ncbi:hypothetical protein TNCV_5120411 [Trichonephila clavipes]|nr:hypothetical protein TNCV_5120411 [Trichonephila clavipes]
MARCEYGRKQNESTNTICIASTLQAGEGDIMCSLRSSTTFYKVICQRWILSEDGYFPWHTAGCRWLKDHDEIFTLLSWLVQSPDIIPSQNLWDKIERGIR